MSSTAACAAISSAGTPSSRRGERGGGEEGGGEEEAFDAQAAERANSSCGSQPEASQASPTSFEKAPGMVLKALTHDRSCGGGRERGRGAGREGERGGREEEGQGQRVKGRRREREESCLPVGDERREKTAARNEKKKLRSSLSSSNTNKRKALPTCSRAFCRSKGGPVIQSTKSAAAVAGEEEGEEEVSFPEVGPPTPQAARHSAEVEHEAAALLSTSEKARTAPGSGEESKARASPRAGAGLEAAVEAEARRRRNERKENEASDVSFLAGDGKGNERALLLLLLLLPPRGGDGDDFVASGMLFYFGFNDAVSLKSREGERGARERGALSFLFVVFARCEEEEAFLILREKVKK